jgi:hypothetical protein
MSVGIPRSLVKKDIFFSKTETVEAEEGVASHEGEGCSDHESAKERVTSYGNYAA